MRLYLVCTSLIILISGASSLDCYICNRTTLISDCMSTITCGSGEVCFSDYNKSEEGGVLHSLGCRKESSCSKIVQNENVDFDAADEEPGNGRECSECCRVSHCNRQLCQHSFSAEECADSADVDCSNVGILVDLCSDTEKANVVCRRFCGLCSYVQGEWSTWSLWSICDVTCENGTRVRTRSCSQPAPSGGGRDCVGQSQDTKSCERSKCPTHGSWSDWATWSSCSSTYEIGLQRRERTCSNPSPGPYGDPCFGDGSDYQICKSSACVDGGWSSWMAWSKCSRTCGDGIRTRSRSCDNPLPSIQGKHCEGDSYNVETCYMKPCPDGGWSSWMAWNECSRTCGDGIRTRSRSCDNPLPSIQGNYCEGDSYNVETCYMKPCPDGGWSSWEAWSKCSRTCGDGIRTRSRSCNNPLPSILGKYCEGDSYNVKTCNTKPCPDGGWSSWMTWSTCSRTCGDGIRTRSRSCDNPIPSIPGKHCEGDSYNVETCNTKPCPDGGWSSWMAWNECSRTCGDGIRTRSRSCDNPLPSLHGKYCEGDSYNVETCNIKPCPVTNGGWSKWTEWTNCSASCNGGIKTRTRNCNNPKPSVDGDFCDDSPFDVQHCNRHMCPITHGRMSTWTKWTSCSASCNGGIQSRKRKCNNPRPSADGSFCQGSPIDVRDCNQQECPRSKASFLVRGANRGSDGILRFSRVELNEGSFYDRTTGVFTCKIPGLYVFIANLVEDGSNSNDIQCMIRLNDSSKVWVYSRQGTIGGNYAENGYETGTAATTLHLVNGDRVYVLCFTGGGLSYSSFTGFLVSADP